MNKYKYITTTLPYINSTPHIGHCFEFCLADIIAEYHRARKDTVFFNVGVDEHGQKISQKAKELAYTDIQEYCDDLALVWKQFCWDFQIDYTNFYRTTDNLHKVQVLRFFKEVEQYLYKKTYKGKYCMGCESFKTEKEIIHGNYCTVHTNIELTDVEEENTFFKLSLFNPDIKDILVDKTLSTALKNLLSEDYDLSVTRKNVEWGIELPDGDTVYVWFDALLNYIFALGYYDTPQIFEKFWANSLQICGKDNLKFQAQIFQAILLAHNIPQTKELLVHGTILDENANKMSKSAGNVIDPIEQKDKFGLSPLKYYLQFGLSTTGDSKYSEQELIHLWNNDIVNKFGNLVSRVLHLVDIKNVDVEDKLPEFKFINCSEEIRNRVFVRSLLIDDAFGRYNFQEVRKQLNEILDILNKRIQDERPFSADCPNPQQVIYEVYEELKWLSGYYQIILKEYKDAIRQAFIENKKVILFKPLK